MDCATPSHCMIRGGARLTGFDNAHRVAARGSRNAARNADHWHRSGGDPGRSYTFTTADQLLADFFKQARRVLAERGVSDDVIGESQATRTRP